jgi:hypothetical protein
MNKLTYLFLMVFCATTLTHASPFSKTTTEALAFTEIQRVRIDFTMPNGYVRHLLLGFTPDNAATDGVDYGYDALNMDNYPDDLNWMINNQRYVIQGVGAFDETKQYPLGMFLTNSGDIAISLDTLENFETEISVYVYDAIANTHTLLNDMDFQQTLSPGTYLERYYITFSNSSNTNELESHLSVSEEEIADTKILYLKRSNEIYIQSNSMISKIEVYNLLGKRILEKENVNSKTLRLPAHLININYGIVKVYTIYNATSKKLVLN